MTDVRSMLESVSDELEIRDLVQRYADATTRLDARGVADTFTEAGEWIAAEVAHLRGRDAMVTPFERLLGDWTSFLQILPGGRVLLDPEDADRAAGRWYVTEMGQRRDGSALTVWGVYDDRYLRDDGSWRIARRRWERLFTQSGGDLEASPFPADLGELRRGQRLRR